VAVGGGKLGGKNEGNCLMGTVGSGWISATNPKNNQRVFRAVPPASKEQKKTLVGRDGGGEFSVAEQNIAVYGGSQINRKMNKPGNLGGCEKVTARAEQWSGTLPSGAKNAGCS